MNAPLKPLADDKARRTALAIHDRSFLVEAGAGSGKTAVMAGRIALMLAEGVAPKTIAAVTFTELAASELFIRVRQFVSELAAGRIPAELQVALPYGLSDGHWRHLASAVAAIDEITCSTIHGFCQRLIRPYPVEADIDPGATVMDRDQANLAFSEITESWLREELDGDGGGLLAEMMLRDPDKTIKLTHEILDHLRARRGLTVDAPETLTPFVHVFRHAAGDFATFMQRTKVSEAETAHIAARFSEMADALATISPADNPADLVRLLLMPRADLCTGSGDFRAYRRKGKWREAARRAGLAKADGDRLNAAAERHYAACHEAWTDLLQAAAALGLTRLVRLVQPVMDRFHDYKRSAALLDFDDLIFAARALLRDHETVRRALGSRFAHVLVDEFQDTDPLQTEIFWRLCGDLPPGVEDADWTSFQIRPGALFLVGDPKQAIYRFRGADVATYVRARKALLAQHPDSVLSISTNFRSREPILRYVNDRFGSLLSTSNGQPGFTALNPFHPERDESPCVAALDIAVGDAEGKVSAERQRDCEAETVADMCARLIGNETILDRKTGENRACRPGDIALLAPTGNNLWRYEEALERRGIPVATQAGKGLFRRQEIQDLIALTRVLADRRDTLAFGALLRGPLVGLTEEELLDIVWALPRQEDDHDALPRLDLRVAPASIVHPHARDVIEKLQTLCRSVNSTTPHDLLAQAIDALRVRAILLQRHRGQAERALANVDLFLSLSRPYAVRGLCAFADAMTTAWTDESKAVEGRPDAQEEAVALYTMHAAKGLEWPIVMPINTTTQIKAPDSAIVDRATGRFYCPVFGVEPTGYEAARDAEKAELDRERIRLWYVALTRACEVLVLPRLDVPTKGSAWISLLDLSLSDLPALDPNHLPLEKRSGGASEENAQTWDIFAAEATKIADRRRRIVWLAPSRDEDAAGPDLQAQVQEILPTDVDIAAVKGDVVHTIQGSRERGVILHKLIEEVLTGETAEREADLMARSEILIRAMGRSIVNSPAQGLVPKELATSVARALTLPEILALRPRLLPEVPIYASISRAEEEEATGGIADAIAFGDDGVAQVVVDWKTDVAPTPESLEHYRAQVRAYLDMTETQCGLIVFVTSGVVVAVTRTTPASLRAGPNAILPKCGGLIRPKATSNGVSSVVGLE
jgi:exodeoxyribonuclease-5